AADMDDGAAACLDHRRKDRLGGEERGGQVEVEARAPRRFRRRYASPRPAAADPVHEDVDPAVTLRAASGNLLHILGLQQVSGNALALAAIGADETGGEFRRRAVAVDGHD